MKLQFMFFLKLGLVIFSYILKKYVLNKLLSEHANNNNIVIIIISLNNRK